MFAEVTEVGELEINQDFFEAGVDSLQVIRMARELKFQGKRVNLSSAAIEKLFPKAFYTHPTLKQLATFVFYEVSTGSVTPYKNGVSNGFVGRDKSLIMNKHLDEDHGSRNGRKSNKSESIHLNGHPYKAQTDALIHDKSAVCSEEYMKKSSGTDANAHDDSMGDNIARKPLLNDADSNSHTDEAQLTTMKTLFKMYVDQLPYSSGKSLFPSPSCKSMVVILTGSTGSLGSYLLETLCLNPNVSFIYCLNRKTDAAKIQEELCSKRGLSPIKQHRVKFFKADLSRAQFGLNSSDYEAMLNSVTHVIRESRSTFSQGKYLT